MAKDKKSSKPKQAPVEEAIDELEELEDDEPAAAAPKKSKKGSNGQEEVAFGAADLAKLASEGRDKPVTARDLRTLLRKMARDGRLNREITAGNRTRYSWSGPDDPEVKAILKALKGGELEQGKQEALAKLKEQKAAKQAAKAKAKAAEVDDDDEDELDDDDE